MKSRLVELDYVRALAVLAIVYCHWSEGISILNTSKWVAASCGNSIFFILSGLLLGLKWREGIKPLGFGFFKCRLYRLMPSYWAFLILFLGALITVGYIPTVKKICLNFFFCGWFDMLPGGRHLWFLTGIIMMYISLIPISYLASQYRSFVFRHKFAIVCCSFVSVIVLQLIIELVGIPQAYLLSMMWGSWMLFLFGQELCEFVKKANVCVIVLLALGLLLSYYGCMHIGWLSNPLFLNYWAALLVGIVTIATIVRVTAQCRKLLIISFLSAFGFEIYLIHHPLCTTGPLCLKNYFSLWIYNLVFIIITVFGAMALHYVAILVNRNFVIGKR